MGTPAERRALSVLAGLLTLGAGVQAVQAHRLDRAPLPGGAQPALDAQLAAVDSARLRQGHRNRAVGATPRAGARVVGQLPIGVKAPAPDRPAPGPVDVDVADEATLEALPGVGPALAKRIVADRAERGAFGSLAGLQRVKGIGPGLGRKLARLIRFGSASR